MEEDKKDDILFKISMQLYDEFNDKFCEISEHLGDVYTYKDLDDLEKAEKDKEIKLLREAIENLIARNKELENITKQYNSYCVESPENAQYKIVIADKRYFDMGIFEEQFIPKSKVEELREIDNIDLLQFKIKQLLQEGDK